GEHLAEELKALDMSAAELARKMKVPTNRVTQILNGTRSITGDTALRLAHFFGTSAQFWLNLQSLYDLRLAQQKTGRSIKFLPRRVAQPSSVRNLRGGLPFADLFLAKGRPPRIAVFCHFAVIFISRYFDHDCGRKLQFVRHRL